MTLVKECLFAPAEGAVRKPRIDAGTRSMSRAETLEEDRDLAVRLKRRDPQSAVALYDRYGKLIYSIIFRAVGNQAIAEDLVQETFFRVWNRIHTFDEERGNFQSWLVTVARNRAFDYLRSLSDAERTATANIDDLDRAGYFVCSDNHADRIARERAVNEALDALTKDQREVIELTHLQGMTQTEIAERLSKPLGTIKGLVRSALKNLRAATMTYKTP